MGHTLSALGNLFFTFLPDQFFNKLELPVESDLTDRTYLITGSNTGLGLAAAIHLAHLNATHLVLGVRDSIKGAKARDEIIAQTKFSGIIDVWELDMATFDSVKSFAEGQKHSCWFGRRTCQRRDCESRPVGSDDGWMGEDVNGIAAGLLAVLLLPVLQATTKLPLPHPDASHMPPHLTITGSAGQLGAVSRKTGNQYSPSLERTVEWTAGDRHFVTKVFNSFLAREISTLRKAEGVVVNVVDPGLSRSVSYLFRTIAWPVSKGSINMVHALLSPTPPGAYISSCEIH
ncbi:hypothetical protein DFH08DRAFT_974139 [Mycena albidolilacea]|uniref:Ketoreductase (KR) domain-containing protein n=1 Tax=Mycena albidolilacea TaxID=1033008 RepID=A0AAD6Z8B8_9AGAR|nr:hypothetical protein DFH08DRAFT_974139 [Mycena albidolilacea]